MGYITLIKLGIAAVLAVIIAASSFNIGRKIEKSEWQERELKREAQEQKIERAKAKELREAMQRVAQQKDKEQNNLLGALNEREREIHRLNTDLADSKRLRFQADRASCNQPAVSRKAKDSSVPDGKIEVELPEQIVRSLRAVIRDAERELINCNALKDAIADNVTIIK